MDSGAINRHDHNRHDKLSQLLSIPLNPSLREATLRSKSKTDCSTSYPNYGLTYLHRKLRRMKDIIYIASDSSGMTKDDMISWLLFCNKSPHYTNQSFDEITGGINEFFCTGQYDELKSLYEKDIKKR